jgi:hypothetical protein
MLTTVSPDRVLKGDKLIGHEGQVQWIAAEDAVVYGTDVSVPVQYQPDGGYGIRYWSADTGATFTVERASAENGPDIGDDWARANCQ